MPFQVIIRLILVFMKRLQGLDDYKAKYAVDEVHYVGDMASVLAKRQPAALHLLCGTNTDRCVAG